VVLVAFSFMLSVTCGLLGPVMWPHRIGRAIGYLLLKLDQYMIYLFLCERYVMQVDLVAYHLEYASLVVHRLILPMVLWHFNICLRFFSEYVVLLLSETSLQLLH
jgi:hypothetical protein